MTELIKRLREADTYNKKYYAVDPLHQEAADRIEELVKEKTALNHLCNAMFNRHIKEITAAEAKLTKAMEALRETDQAIMLHTDETDWRLWGEVAVGNIRTALAELEGKE